EHSWNYEGGVKTSLRDRVSFSAAAFRIDWRDLQVNVPNPQVPAQFFIANAAGATSQGLELELSARPAPGVDVFGGLGYTHARFQAGSASNGVNVGGHTRAHAQSHTADVGIQYA